jgi:hypothetical protein
MDEIYNNKNKKLFTKKINRIVLGDMTRPAIYVNPRYSEAHYYRVLLYVLLSSSSSLVFLA